MHVSCFTQVLIFQPTLPTHSSVDYTCMKLWLTQTHKHWLVRCSLISSVIFFFESFFYCCTFACEINILGITPTFFFAYCAKIIISSLYFVCITLSKLPVSTHRKPVTPFTSIIYASLVLCVLIQLIVYGI